MPKRPSAPPGREPSAPRRPGFRSIEELEVHGLAVFLRADPFVLESLPPPASSAATSAKATSPSAEPERIAPSVPTPSSEAAGAETSSAETSSARGEAASNEGALAEPARERSSLERLLERGARVIIGTSLAAERRGDSQGSSIEDLALSVSERLGADVLLPDELVGDSLIKALRDLRQGQVCVLPDLAPVDDDDAKGEAFARRLAPLLEAYVGDAFSVCHRADASVARLPRLVRQRALGERMGLEVEQLGKLMSATAAPLVLVVGGARFSDKSAFLQQWAPRASHIVLGGGVASTVLAAQGVDVGQTEHEPERLAEARSFIARARGLGVQLVLPVDAVVQSASGAWLEGSVVAPRARARAQGAPSDVVPIRGLRSNVVISDVGPESLAQIERALSGASSVLWWDGLGRGAAASTAALARLLSASDAHRVVVGAELGRALSRLEPELRAGLGLVSSGAEAALALLTGRRLPGLEVLREP